MNGAQLDLEILDFPDLVILPLDLEILPFPLGGVS